MGALRQTGTAAGVGNEDHPLGSKGGKNQPDRCRVDVDAIADQLCPDLGVFRCRGDHAGVPVVNAGHGVEHMGQMGGAGVKYGLGLVVGAVRVGHGHGSQILGPGGELHRPRQLRGQIHDFDQAAAVLPQLLKALKIRVLQVGGVLGSPLFVGEVGPLHVDAPQHAGPGDRIRL